MSERNQVILKVIGLILVAGLMGLALYFMIFGNSPAISPPGTDGQPDTGGIGGLPSAGNGTPGSGTVNPTPTPGDNGGVLQPSPVANGGLTETTLLTTGRIVTPTVNTNGSVTYYDPNDGKFYTIDKTGKITLLSQATFPQASKVVLAANASAAVLEFPDGSNVVYDFNASQQTTLPAHWEDFSFSGDGTSIASKSVGLDPSNRSLVMTSVDGTNTKVIASLGDSASQVDVSVSPNSSILGFSKTGESGNAFGQNEVYLIDPNGEAAGVLIVNGANFKNTWSPDGTHLLYSVADAGDEYRASLWYSDSRGDRGGATRLRLSVKTTADKCVFASATLAYCAVPATMAAGGGSVPSPVSVPDNLYSISLPSGTSTLVAMPSVATKMNSLSVSADAKNLYYTDALGRLNSIALR